jgi:hypothetical protein
VGLRFGRLGSTNRRAKDWMIPFSSATRYMYISHQQNSGRMTWNIPMISFEVIPYFVDVVAIAVIARGKR